MKTDDNSDGAGSHHSDLNAGLSSNTAAGVSNPNMEDVSRINVRVPPFWKANPALWFCQLEAQFAMNKITSDRTKYCAVVAAIESTILQQVSDLVLNPPNANLYTSLKERLLNVFAESEHIRLKKLLGDFELGDKRPSLLLREMKNLSSNIITDAGIIKALWLQRLPTNTQAILSVSTENLDRLAVMADKIHETTLGAEVQKISSNPSETTIETQLAELSNQLSELKTEFSRHKSNRSDSYARSNYRNDSRSNSRSRADSNLRSRSQTPPARRRNEHFASYEDSKVCWYHHKWGNKAERCIPPCNYKNRAVSKN